MKKNKNYTIVAPFSPTGDQPQAIEQIMTNFNKGIKNQVLMGVTGSGKTFTMANIIKELGKPVLVMSHNKTLAAQLYGELKNFFPDNAVEYFISYYDYYQPEAYLPTSDTFIEKTTAVNQEIERLRLKATSSLMQRNDVIIVSSVSCIYGLGSPEDYKELSIEISVGSEINRRKFFNNLIDMQYTRNKYDLSTGSFRVKGDIIDIHPAYEETGIRLETFGDEIEGIKVINFLTGEILREEESINIFPAKHFVVTKPKIDDAVLHIQAELDERIDFFKKQGMLLELQRIDQRTRLDIEFLKEMGVCSGIENYSRHLSGRKAGERPACLLDYFPNDFLLIIDESHVSIPQVRAMFNGDRARKKNLVDYGFRLPSALDNRPLKFEEFEKIIDKVLYVSATPANYEIERAGGEVIEQIIRPTGILDPVIEIRPVLNQIDDLIEEIRIVSERKERILVTTLTKRMAEDLTSYLISAGIKAKYLHSDIDSMERIKLIRELRLGEYDVLVGINLLREGLDLPEVSLVAVLDADREGFLRDKRSLMQTSGRAARNINSKVIFYAERITDSMQACIDETKRRRKIQHSYNLKHGITPQTVTKSKAEIINQTTMDTDNSQKESTEKEQKFEGNNKKEITNEIINLTAQMQKAAEELKFELAAELRDRIDKLKKNSKQI